MTVSDDVASAEREPLLPPYVRWAVAALLLGGGAAGAAAATLHRPTAGMAGPIVCLILGLGAVISAFRSWKILRQLSRDGRTAPSVNRSRNLILASCLLGGIVGMVMAVTGLYGKGGPSAIAVFADTPLSPMLAVLLLAALGLTLWLSILWHLSIDEHEMAAYNFGAVAATYIYFTASVGWWLAWRGGFTPEPDGKLIFAAVMTVWLLGWLYKRSR